MKCCEKLEEFERKKLFEGFWASADYNAQNSGCVKIVEPKCRYGAGPRRSYTCVYLNKGAISVRVCKSIFLRTLNISNGRVDRALKAKVKANGSPVMDEHGHHEPANKTKEEDLEFVKKHIESFPKYRSHYSRQDNPNRQYLSSKLCVSKMYELYVAKCEEAGCNRVSEWVHRKVCFNLSFGV